MFKMTSLDFLHAIPDLPLSPWVALFIAGLVGFAAIYRSSQPFKRVGKSWLFSLLSGPWGMTFTTEKHVQYGYENAIKATSKPFIMKWWGLDHIFLPRKYLPDLRRADAHRLSFFKNLNEAFSLDASFGDLYSSNLMADVVRREINPRLAQITPLLESEATYAIAQEIGSSQDWLSFPAAQLFSRIMHRTTSRILVGSELCRDESFLETSQALGESTFTNASIFSMLPPLGPFGRPVRRFISCLFHQRVLRQTVDIVLPVVQSRFDNFQAPASTPGNTNNKHLDAIEWTLRLISTTYPVEHDPYRITLTLLQNLWASNAGPAEILTQMIFQILLDPVYLPPLRSEIESAFTTTHGGGFTEKALNKMPLLDSFLREINRLYPTDAVTCARTVTDPSGFVFHDGLRLPAGSRIAVPALAIQTDVANYEDPLRFDGWRFARLRDASPKSEGEQGETASGESKYGAATVSETYLPFGIGRHSCPGRWYAILMIKLVFAKLILEYALKWDLNEGVIQKVRPASRSLNGMFAPNQTQKVWLRRRG
ncbi:cytochrome P450 [Cladorrhinum sp. PSN259]|nr:cytochrome P450 [Cladorrhinum sp. PSN259]